MTKEEKARQIVGYAKNEDIISSGCCQDYDKYDNYHTALEMAQWKDEQHKKDIADLQRKLNAEKELRKQVEDSVRGLPQPIKDLIKAMNMII